MIPLSTEERVTLVCTADDDVKVKRKKPYRMVPIQEAEINGGVPLSFVVRTLNSREQMRFLGMIQGGDVTETTIAALDIGVLEVAGINEETGKKFHASDPVEVREIMKGVPCSIQTLIGAWITDNSWGNDPLVKKK